MFPCPSCSEPLARSPRGAVEHWGCTSCRGRAFLFERLGRAVPAEFAEKIRAAVEAGGRRSARRCPLCTMHFLGLRVPQGAGEFALDFCDQCSVVWFDPGEHEAATREEAEPPGPHPYFDRPNPVHLRVASRSLESEVDISDRFLGGGWQEDVPAILGLPVAEDRPTESRPVVTWALLAIVGIASVVAFACGLEKTIAERGLVPRVPLRHGGLDFLTSVLIHGSVWHLASNLYFLGVFGKHAEDLLRPGKYLLLFAASALAGSLLFVALASGSRFPSIGASGGISGILAYYALALPHVRVRLLWLVYFQPVTLTFTARYAFLAWIALQAAGAYLQLWGVHGTNYFAHLGGAAVGTALWYVWRE